MPSRNQQKQYEADAFYHIYNRGVGKMTIFHDKQDYATFLYYVRLIFSPLEELQKEFEVLSRNVSLLSQQQQGKIKSLQNAINRSVSLKVHENVELLSFNLMPNHFHLSVYQKTKEGIEKLMRRLGSGYSGFYQRRYDWVGPVMQGRYHASLLKYDPELQALAVARYVERNTLDLPFAKKRSLLACWNIHIQACNTMLRMKNASKSHPVGLT